MKKKAQSHKNPESPKDSKVPESSNRRFQLATRLNLNYGSQFILVDDKGKELQKEAIHNALLTGLEFLSEHYPDDFPVDRYTEAHRPFYVGVSVVKNGRIYLVPSFNGNGLPNLKCEFTAQVEHFGILKQPILRRKICCHREMIAVG